MNNDILETETETENDDIYNEYIAECTMNTFMRIGNSLIEPEQHIQLKTLDELYFEYLTKLDNKIDRLFYKQEQIMKKINVLTLENKITSDNVKSLEDNLNNKNILSFIKYYSSSETLITQLDNEKEKYDNTFIIITNLYEIILEIEEKIKNTKEFKKL